MPILNPGFEEGIPNNWNKYSTGTTQRYLYPELGRDGGSSVAIEYPNVETGKMAMWAQSIQIDVTKKYKLSGWMKTQNIIGDGSSIRIDWKDTAGKYLGTSAIMARQKGTIPWKYFEGIVTPHTGAVKATIVLDIYNSSGKVWFDDMSFLEILNISAPHPNMYSNDDEINTIKQKIANNDEPWKSAYLTLKSYTDTTALSTPIQSVTYGGPIWGGDKHNFYAPSGGDSYDYNAAINIRNATRALGIMYVLTKDEKYAIKAKNLIEAWCIDANTKMNPRFTDPQSQIDIFITMAGMLYGADLIWNSHNVEEIRPGIKSWTSTFVTNAKALTGLTFNWIYWRDNFVGACAIITETPSNLEWAIEEWKSSIPHTVDTDGSLIFERSRTRPPGYESGWTQYGKICDGISYSTVGISAMLSLAEIARHHGYDLYTYKVPGTNKGVELACDFYGSYCHDIKGYHPLYANYNYQCCEGHCVIKGSNPSGVSCTGPVYTIDMSCGGTCQSFWTGQYTHIYELAYTFIGKKTDYKNVIRRWGGIPRYMYDDRVFGPTTLTHGSTLI